MLSLGYFCLHWEYLYVGTLLLQVKVNVEQDMKCLYAEISLVTEIQFCCLDEWITFITFWLGVTGHVGIHASR